MRKFLSLLLAMCMAFSLCMTGASAAGNDEDTDNGDMDGSGVFNVRVPDVFDIHMDKDGRVGITGEPAIENLGDRDVEIAGIRVAGESGWDVLDFNNDFSGMAVNEKKLAMAFRGDGTRDTGEVALSEGNWVVSGDSSLVLNPGIRMPPQDACEDMRIATVYWDFDWFDDNTSEEPGGDDALVIPVLPGEGGSVSVDFVTAGDDNRLSVFPDVTADEGYVFDHWENQDGNPVDENTVFVPGDEIRPVFEPDPDWNPDKTVTVPVLSGENGSCDASEITTGSDGKISVFPGVTPDEGYMFDRWENQDGNPVDENTVFVPGDEIRPVFKTVEYVDFIVTQTNRDMVGYTGVVGENLDIPSTFLGDDGVYYRVVGIRWNAFYGAGLASVSIPEGCRYVESGAFKNCNSLTEVSFPSTLDYIASQAFEYTALMDVTIPASVTSIGIMAFRHIPTLRSVTFESGSALETLGGYAFANTGLTSFVIPSGVTAIQNNLFYQCGSLRSVTIPGSVTEIGIGAFEECSALNLTVPDSVSVILEYAFLGIGSVTYHGSASGRPWGADRVN